MKNKNIQDNENQESIYGLNMNPIKNTLDFIYKGVQMIEGVTYKRVGDKLIINEEEVKKIREQTKMSYKE
jgi:hypothetical protein